MQKPPKITLMILFLSAKLQGTLVVKKKKTMRRGYSGIFLLYVEKGFIGWFSQSSRWEVFWKIFSIKHFLGITWWHEKKILSKIFSFYWDLVWRFKRFVWLCINNYLCYRNQYHQVQIHFFKTSSFENLAFRCLSYISPVNLVKI